MGDGVYDFVLYLCNEIMKTVEAYTPEMEREWNDHVATSRNGTFLLDRRYMDYHADRFCDASMVARDDHGRLLAFFAGMPRGGYRLLAPGADLRRLGRGSPPL